MICKLGATELAKYLTKQRRILQEYLAGHADEFLTAGQIAAGLAGKDISVSAIYRNLAELEREGKVCRSAGHSSQENCYRYTDACECREHLHLTCLRCGKTLHMQKESADRLAENLALQEGFDLAREDTVLYGICSACSRRKEQG